MKRLFSLVIKLALILALAIWLADRPGTAHIVWHNYVIETSAAFLGLMVFAAGFFIYFLFRIWNLLRHGPERWRIKRKLDKAHQGHRHITAGLIAVAGGDAAEAGQAAVQARKHLGITPITQLLHAQAAQLAGDYQTAKKIFLNLAAESESAVLGYRGLIMEAFRAGDRADAERLIEKLHRLRPETPWLNLARFELAARKQAWGEADAALSKIASDRLMDPVRAKRHQAAVLVAASQEAHDDNALQSAERAARLAPDWLPAIITLAQLQLGAGHKRAMHRTIERAWPTMPHPQLAAIYRAGSAGDPITAYKDMEHLCRTNEENIASRLALAEAALEADIWGEARRHLLALAGRGEATQSVYRLLARLERRESGNEQAALQWLTRAIDASPDPVWLCRNCGGGHQEWRALCSDCGMFDTLEWQTPGKSRAVTDMPSGFLAWTG